MNIFSSIRSQAKLLDGWHYGEGSAANQSSIDAALELCAQLLKRGYNGSDMEDFPYSNGKIEVVLEANLEVSFIVENTNSVRVRFYTGDEYILIAAKVKVSDAVEFIPKRECNTFATYISEISEEEKEVTSEAKAFGMTIGAGYPSSNWNASIVNQAVHVPMPRPSTGTSPTLLRYYSSPSGKMNYLHIRESSIPLQTTRATSMSRFQTKKRQTPLFAKSPIVSWDEFNPVEAMDLTPSA
jgi:hypothetical protein